MSRQTASSLNPFLPLAPLPTGSFYPDPHPGPSHPQRPVAPISATSSAASSSSSAPRDDLIDILRQISTWVWNQEVLQKILTTYHQKGGWEGWAQVEIAYFITKNNKVTIDREVEIYTATRKRVDFIITDPGKVKQIIELKCERQSLWGTKFKDAYVEDIRKFRGSVFEQYKNTLLYAVAITCTDEGRKEMSKIEMLGIKRQDIGQISVWCFEFFV